MVAPLPLRKFWGELLFFAGAIFFFAWGFWVDVPQVEQIAGQSFSLTATIILSYLLFTPPGQQKALKAKEPTDMSDPTEQWLLFVQVTFIILTMVVFNSLDWALWSRVTVALPLGFLVFACVLLALRPWVRKRRAARNEA